MAIVGYVLLGILAIIFLLLCIPVRLILRYQTGIEPVGQLRWLFFRIDLLKVVQEKTKEPQKQEPKEKKPAPKKGKKPLAFSHMLGSILDLLASLKGGVGMIVRGFRLYRVRLLMVVAGEDAAQTAVEYGTCNAMIYSAYALAKNFLNLCNPEIDIRPNFVSEESSVDFEMRGWLLPITLLGAALRIFASFLVKTIQRKKLQQE